jgi:tetratricopeptide (TPR) repeat protein
MLARAVDIDPRYSTAYGFIAICHTTLLIRGWGSVADVMKQGLEAAKLAVETGRDDPRALAWAANSIARCGGNKEEALAHIERALALNPDSTHVRRMSGFTCLHTGKHERSIEHFKRAMQLDPMDPWVSDTYHGIALSHFFTGRYEEALAWADKALLERPNYVPAFRLRIAASAMAGRPSQELQEAIGRLRTVAPEVSITKTMLRIAVWRQVDRDLYAKALRLAGLPNNRVSVTLRFMWPMST